MNEPDQAFCALTVEMYGIDSSVPMKGSCRRKVITTGKKSLLRIIFGNVVSVGQSSTTTGLGIVRGLVDEEKKTLPKQVEETKCLDDNTNERPFEEHEQDSAEETDRAPDFLLPREEIKRLLRADD